MPGEYEDIEVGVDALLLHGPGDSEYRVEGLLADTIVCVCCEGCCLGKTFVSPANSGMRDVFGPSSRLCGFTVGMYEDETEVEGKGIPSKEPGKGSRYSPGNDIGALDPCRVLSSGFEASDFTWRCRGCFETDGAFLRSTFRGLSFSGPPGDFGAVLLAIWDCVAVAKRGINLEVEGLS